ncbi:DUF7010 family protein [Qipengyuania sediminis]|uniref:DUF7010 family protein n=1 Tax=Qipengyuania sediminis TaxID=1532023 RepID=UPI0010596E53|nr:hypothetical protein [Qipengyuania sediminis]
MTVSEAQRQIRVECVGGGPGALVSALVWLAAALVYRQSGYHTGFATLFFGGFLIYPLSVVLCRLIYKRSASVAGNPLGGLGLESTIAMIGCLLAAWLLLDTRPEWVFPIAAIAVGTHYFTFKTMYGDRTYWLLGAVITALGCAVLFWLPGQTSWLMLAVAAVELVFGIVLTRRAVREGVTAA